MSEEKKTEETKSNPATDVLNTLKGNPKAMYAVGGAVAIALLAMFFGGGSGETQMKPVAVSTGQMVTLENPNGGNSQVSGRPGLVSTSAAEEDKEENVCVATPGTKGQVEEEQRDATGLTFVKIKITDGPCSGKSGWTSKVNIKGG